MPIAEPTVVNSLPAIVARFVRPIGRRFGELGNAEVEHLGLAAAGDEQVGRLDVAMDDGGAVRGVERIGDLDAEVEQVVERQRAARDALLERLALEQLHHHEVLALLFADVVKDADVRVTQARDDAGFAEEALERLGDAAGFGGQELERDVAAEAGVFGFVDFSHAPAAELREEFVVGDGARNHGGIVAEGFRGRG